MKKVMKQKSFKAFVRSIIPRLILKRIYRRAAFSYIGSISPPSNPDRRSMLIINHFFDQDVRALAYADDCFNRVEIRAERLFKGARIFFRRDVQDLKAPYVTEEPSNLADYRQECELIFERLRQRFNPSVIVVTSDNFYWVREFIHVARQAGVRVVVLDKEGVLTPHTFKDGARRTRDYAPFMSDHIYVYSDRQREYWKNIGALNNQITVVGQPRSDLFYRERNCNVDGCFEKPQPLVTLFSYEDTAYIKFLRSNEDVSWRAMKTETHDTVYGFAQEHPDWNFVIKTHPQQQDLEELQARYRGLENLRVIGGSALANELIQRSELLIMFQTISLIEAMFMNKRVVYTAWDRHYARFQDDILPFHKAAGIRVAETYEQFMEICRRFFKGDHSDFEFSEEALAGRNRFIDGYLHRPDGHVCERFFEAVSRLVS